MNMKNVEDFYPLSPMQQGMLFHSLLAPDSGVYHEQVSCILSGDLDPQAFEQAWQLVINRHSILRTGFIGEKLKEPIQVVHRKVPIHIYQEDWSEHDQTEQEILLEQYMTRDREQAFDLSAPPLLRLALFQLNSTSWRFAWSHHHILLDGWSIPILLQEVFYIYSTLLHPAGVEPLPLPRPYRDYISWLRRQERSSAENFWRAYLEGFNTPTPLIEDWLSDEELVSVTGFREEESWLSQEETAQLQATAREMNVTLSTLVQGAWGLVLGRYSMLEDIVFGVTVSGRPPDMPDSEEMVGLFINTMPFRVKLDSAVTLRKWLKELQAGMLEIRQYEYSSLLDIQSWSSVPRGSPLFETLLVYENYPIQTVIDDLRTDLQVEDVRSVEQTNFALNLVAGCSDRLMLKLVYDARRYSEGGIQRILEHLRVILSSFASSPDQLLSAVPYMPADKEKSLINEWQALPAECFIDKNVIHLIEDQTAGHPSSTALDDTNSVWSYGELNKRANQVARYLHANDVAPGSFVAVSMEHSADLIAAILGVLKSGSAYLPLDPAIPAERLAFIFQDSQAEHLLTNSQLLDRFTGASIPTTCLDAAWDSIAKLPGDNLKVPIPRQAPAYIIYTSGSTGQPKGVLLGHAGLSNLSQALVKSHQFDPASRNLVFSSISFDASVMDIFSTLIAGGTLVLAPRETLSSVTGLQKTIQEKQATYLFLPPSMLALLPPDQSPSLRTICVGGEVLPVEVARRWAPRLRLINAYGPTETTVVATNYLIEYIPEHAERIPIGRPLPNISSYILDPDLRPVPIGVPGELHVGGVCLAIGYLNRPDLTAEKFVPNPFETGESARLYKTGDIVRYRPDGLLEFIGRRDGQVKIRGFRIEVGEVESVLGQHPEVKGVVVNACPDPLGATADAKQLAAYVIPQEGTQATLASLRTFLKGKLPDYMLPTALVLMETFPLNTSGKVDRKSLPLPETAQATRANQMVEPRDMLEQQLRTIWEDVLGIRPISVKDNFFDLGGHSLVAVRLMARVKEKLNQDFQLVTLFQDPTIEGLAAALRRTLPGADETLLVPLQPLGSKPPLFFIHPSGGSVHWYLELAFALGQDQPFYAIQAVGLEGQRPLQTRVEAMAATYIEAIKTIRPEGPYLIGSWSLGVIIAYEIARQLTAQGDEVGFVGLLDQGPAMPYAKPEDDAAYLVQVFGEHLALDVEELRRLSPHEQVQRVLEIARQANWIYPDVTFEQFSHFVNLMRTHADAWRAYEAHPFPGRVVLFRAAEQARPVDATPDLGWARLALGGVEIREVPGDHLSMIHDPHVQILAEQIAQSIEQNLSVRA